MSDGPESRKRSLVTPAPDQGDDDQEAIEEAEAQELVDTLGKAVEILYEKPKEKPQKRPPRVDPYAGKEWRIEFVPGARRGTAGKEMEKLPAVRVTAGGRPVPGVDVEFQVSHGELAGGGKAFRVQTDAAGIARLKRWRLEKAGEYRVTAECRFGYAEYKLAVID
jgi:hypothetical protein